MRPILVAALLSVCGVVLVRGQEAPPAHAPKIVCPEPTFNFGERDNNEDVLHAFVIRNEGDLTLEIGHVRPACGCTVANVSRKSIPPGEQGEITTRLSLRGRHGPQHKTISVESNDPTTPTLTLALEGTAVAEIEVRPMQLFFGRITTDAAVTGTVEVIIQGTNTLSVTKAVSDQPLFKAWPETAEDGKLYRILVATQPPLPRGTLRGGVTIETDSPRHPSLSVTVSAFVVGEFAFAPEEIGLVEQSVPVQRYVIVRSETGTHFEVPSVEPPSPTIQANISAMDATSYRIDLNNIVATEDLDGKVLRITVAAAGATREILIPFRVTSSGQPPP